MKQTHIQRHGRIWLLLISAAALLQSMYPSGYMPTSFTGGWPVMLCPDGLPTGFLLAGKGEHSSHHPHDDQAQDSQTSDTCPIGKAFECNAMPMMVMSMVALFVTIHRQFISDPNRPSFRLRVVNHARAPPFFQAVFKHV